MKRNGTNSIKMQKRKEKWNVDVANDILAACTKQESNKRLEPEVNKRKSLKIPSVCIMIERAMALNAHCNER